MRYEISATVVGNMVNEHDAMTIVSLIEEIVASHPSLSMRLEVKDINLGRLLHRKIIVAEAPE